MKTCIRSIFISCFLFLFAQQSVMAIDQSREDQFKNGILSYSSGEYQAAIQTFESLLEDGISAPLFYNLANSYAQDGQSGRAILNYERALRLNPGNSDIRGNIELVRRDQGLFQEEQSAVQYLILLFGLNQWLWITAGAFLLFVVVLLLPSSIVSKRIPRYGIAAVSLLVTALAAFGVAGQYQIWNDGVVVAEGARIRVSPFESSASVGAIQQGRLVHPGKIHNNYVLIVDEAGRSGWLNANLFEAIATPSASR